MSPRKSFLKAKDGASAVEFALIAPMFFMVLLTMLAFGIYLSAANSVQQIAADAARSAVAGINATERKALVTAYVNTTTFNHPLIRRERLTVTSLDDPLNPNQFTVSVDYDARDLPIWNLYSYVMPDQHIRTFSTIRLGGI